MFSTMIYSTMTKSVCGPYPRKASGLISVGHLVKLLIPLSKYFCKPISLSSAFGLRVCISSCWLNFLVTFDSQYNNTAMWNKRLL